MKLIIAVLEVLRAVPCGTGDSEVQQQLKGAALAIWTTTPWSMPANVAVAVHPRLKYSLVEVQVSLPLLTDLGGLKLSAAAQARATLTVVFSS